MPRMGNHLARVADRLLPAAIRAAGAGALALLVAAIIAAANPPLAQIAVAGSELAGVTFPSPSSLWVPDAARSQATALEESSILVDKACGPTEFHIWDAVGGERDQMRVRVDTAFAEAGWSLGVISLETSGRRIYSASRQDEELVMAWLPQSESIGLVLCEVAGPRVANAPGVADPIAQPTPLPRPRPDPNAARIVEPEPEPDPVPDPAIDAPVIGPIEPADGDPDGGVIGGLINRAVDGGEPEPDRVAAPEEESSANTDSGFSIWLLLTAIVLAAGSYFLLRWGRVSARAIAGATWTPTIATVIYSDIAAETRKDRAGRDVQRFLPVVAYEYTVDGTEYQAARMRFTDSALANLDDARRVAERFPVGAGIEIRYDPAMPSEATIEADPDRFEYRMIGGIALAVLALAALVSSFG